MAHTPGPLALVGSGEFLPAMADTDAALLDGRPPAVAVIPAAAAREGEATLRHWFELAHSHYGRMGVDVVEVDVRSRADAEDPALAQRLADVGLIYLSGGDPAFLAGLIHDTALGSAIATSWRSGVALAGCSAGAMALGRRTLSVRGGTVRGLGLAGDIVVIPHYDRSGFARRVVGGLAGAVARGTVVGIDEDTAVVWQPEQRTWVVMGRSRAWVVDHAGLGGAGFDAGEAVPLDPPSA